MEADGGSRGNPGPAGYGALVRDADSQAVLARRNGYLGRATNNAAEYAGLIAGLRAAVELDPHAQVAVRMDSKLVVEQMSGRWQVKHPDLRPLAKQAAELAARLAAVSYTWVPRAQNGDADRLANEAMDARRGTYDSYDDLPPAAGERLAEPAATPWREDPSGPPLRLLLLRHGQTELSVARRFSGLGDPPLTELGRRQAQAAAQALADQPIEAVISSPLRRARDTAQAVADRLGRSAVVDQAWRETDFGAFEGLSFTEVRQRYPAELDRWLADPAVPPPGGESFAQVTERVQDAYQGLVAQAMGATVLVVSHVTPMKVVARLVLDAPAALFALHLDLAASCEVHVYPDGRASLRRWNDTAYLAAISAP